MHSKYLFKNQVLELPVLNLHSWYKKNCNRAFFEEERAPQAEMFFFKTKNILTSENDGHKMSESIGLSITKDLMNS